jgi:hypothetical protein
MARALAELGGIPMRRLVSAAMAASLLLAVVIAPVGAAKPERFVIDQSEATDFVNDIVDAACGVDLDVTFQGHVIGSIWFDAEGNPVKEIDRFSTRAVFRNPDTGAVYRFTDAGPDQYRFDWDAGTITYSIIGRSVTGSAYAGRVVLLLDIDTGDVIGDPLHVSGVELGDWVENVCAAVG